VEKGDILTVITKLEARGFKSFAKKTEIDLLPGFNCILGANGHGKSILGSSKVFVIDKGFEKIEDLVENKLRNNWEKKKLDDGIYVNGDNEKIITINQNTMKQEIRFISKYIKRKGEPELYEIKTRGGKKLTATGCHPIISYKDHHVRSCLISELKENDRIAAPRNIKGDFDYHNPELARLFGYIIGDGCVSQGQIDFTNMDTELIEDYQNIIKNQFGRNKFYIYNKGKAVAIIFSQKNIFEFFQKKFNTTATKGIKKNIPAEFMFADDETVGNLLAGLYDTDGYFNKKGMHIEFCNKNEYLVDQIQMLLLRFGIISIKKEKEKYATNTEKKIRRKYFLLYVYGNENYKKFYEKIPIRVKHKKEALEKGIKNVQANENIDLLPREVNQSIKECVKTLGLKVKCLRKEYPKLVAYAGDRCCPSREGLNEILDLFVNRWFELYSLYVNTPFEIKYLTEAMQTINISSVECANEIRVAQNTINRSWKKELFEPRAKNHVAYYNYIRKRIADKLEISKYLIVQMNKLVNSDIFWDEIVSIKKVPGVKYVYDLTIEGTHNFIAEGLYAHNSNVVDAICFVLGKSSARELRAEKSANLIYNGGKNGKPATDAEVSITFDNAKKVFPVENKEVKITRIVKQSGNSTYKMNDQVMTRQQVVDILAAAKIDPDGHNIVLQGDIVHFMEMKPVERREIIEEISGISIFEEKKEKTMNELNRVQEKLNEAEIILTEREKTLKDLKKDRDQALEYKELEKNIERNKATRISLMLKNKEEELGKQESKFKDLETDIQKLQTEITSIKEEIATKKKEIEAINHEINEKGDARQREISKDIEYLKTKIIKDGSRKDVCENELKRLKERKVGLDENIKEYEKKIIELKKEQDKLTKENEELKKKEEELVKKIELFKKKHGITNQEEISKVIEVLDKKIDDKQKEALAVEENKQNELRKRDILEFEIKSLDERISRIKELKKEDEEKFSKLKRNKEEFKVVLKKLSDALNNSSVYSAQLSSTRNSLMDAQEEFAKLRTKNIGIKEFTAGDIAIKKIIEQNINGVYGTVSDLGQVPSKYSLAMEVAAGQRMKSIVVATDLIAAKCIQYLKENKLGVVTFLPLNKLQERVISEEEKKIAKEQGVQGLAIDLVKYESKFASVFKYVLGGTLIVEDINTARRIGIGRARMVSLTGDLLEVSGAMIGGYRRESGLGFQQKEVSEGLEKTEKEMTKLIDLVALLEKKKVEVDEEVVYCRERKVVLEAEIKAAEVAVGSEDPKEIEAKKKELVIQIKEIDSKSKAFNENLGKIEKEFERMKAERQAQIEALTKSGSSEMSKELEAFELQKQNFRENRIKNDSERNSMNNQIEMYSNEKEKIVSIMKGIEKENETFSKEMKILGDELKANNDILKIKEKTQKEFYAEYKEMFNKRNKCEEFIQKKDSVLIRDEERIRGIENSRNEVSIKKAVIGGEVEGLRKEFEIYKEVQLRRGIELEELNAEIKNFENMLRNLGNVNLRALEIYEKVDEEYKALLEKFDKLKLEKEDVLKLMFEIESKKQETFMRTFKLLERNFKEIFSSLSTKGEAELVIENPESVFEGGVDIRVKIVGSKYLDIKSLSGGEKTLTALAFIFAIQEFEPSWFYLMDEVDAALDKKNSELLSKLIGKYSKGAQYIVISHNDAIISEANTIYGVAMQDGISKVVSLKV
jgi:chromosome segregation protein